MAPVISTGERNEDEEATFRTLSSHRKIIDAIIQQHHGRFVNSAGDSVLAEFASVVNVFRPLNPGPVSLNTNDPTSKALYESVGGDLS